MVARRECERLLADGLRAYVREDIDTHKKPWVNRQEKAYETGRNRSG